MPGEQNYNPIVNMEVLRHLRQNMMGQQGQGAETPQGGGIQLPHPVNTQPKVIEHSLSNIKHTKKGF